MKAPWSGKLSAAKTGWLVLILFFGWLAFFLVPAPKPKPEPLPAFVVKPPSRLVALGLPDNPDLEHLPEFFALYANKVEWEDDKTIFAYWNPGSSSYSYFFEATRVDGTYFFRSIDDGYLNSEDLTASGSLWENNLPEDSPIRFLLGGVNYRHYLQHGGTIKRAMPTLPFEIKPERTKMQPGVNQQKLKPPPPEMKLEP